MLLDPGDLPPTGGYVQILDSSWSENFAGYSSTFLRIGVHGPSELHVFLIDDSDAV